MGLWKGYRDGETESKTCAEKCGEKDEEVMHLSSEREDDLSVFVSVRGLVRVRDGRRVFEMG